MKPSLKGKKNMRNTRVVAVLIIFLFSSLLFFFLTGIAQADLVQAILKLTIFSPQSSKHRDYGLVLTTQRLIKLLSLAFNSWTQMLFFPRPPKHLRLYVPTTI